MFEKLFVLLLLIIPEQKQEDRRHALEKMGISVQSSGIKVSLSRHKVKIWVESHNLLTGGEEQVLPGQPER